ncbi:MAG: restriction endonuclease subunit S [Betaproteobacteria bacterium]
MIDAKKVRIGAIAEVRAGYPFRGAIDPASDGQVTVVQIKDLAPDGSVTWARAIRTELPGRRQPYWLETGDLLLVARGKRYSATALDGVPSSTVCGPHLYQLRPKSRGTVLPAFLAWQINQAPLQTALRAAAEGSNQLSVRRPVIEALPIAVPPLPEQRRIIDLARAAARERVVLDGLIRNRERQLNALAHALANVAGTS